MIKLGPILFVAFCAASAASCATPIATPAAPSGSSNACLAMTTSGPDADELARLEERGARANVEGWSVEEARAFFAPEWTSVQPNGTNTNLDAVLNTFQNGRSIPWAGRFDITNLDIRVYCDTAVVIGSADAYRIGASGDGAQPAVHFRWLNVWRKVNGHWVYAANEYTRY